MGHDANDVAEMLHFGLEENDKVANSVVAGTVPNTNRVAIQIETDTGQKFIAEVYPVAE